MSDGRTVTLVLVTQNGDVVGALPPFPVATPYWPDVEPVVVGALEHHGVDVTVLRLLEADRPMPPGGSVTYVAEVSDVPAATELSPWDRPLDDHTLRLSWARPGGPAADVAWAEGVLEERGLRRIGPASQIRTWNLSSLWRLPAEGQTVWLKHVPPFFEHEGRILERLQGRPVPPLLAYDGPRLLMLEIPGEDLYGAPEPRLLQMVSPLVELQREWIGRTHQLLALGLPDWRADALSAAIGSVVERVARELSNEDRWAVERLSQGLPERFAAIAECGLPDTLVHGDFHPGNHRGDATSLVLLDWGDSGVGHPLLDEAAFLDHIPAESVSIVQQQWHRAWREAVPGSDPDRASALLRPLAAARQALIYQKFLDGIEPSEHPYHRADPAHWLQRTAALLRAEE